MANIEFKDIVEERNAGDAAPVGTEIFAVQTNPSDPDVADRPYQKWSWLYIVEQVKAAIGNATTSVSGLLSATDKTKLDAQSNTNTGDETTATIKTKLGAATNLVDGYLLASDWAMFDNKQDALGFTAENVANKNATNGYVGLSSGLMDGDQLPAMSTTKKGGVPATGTPSGKFLKDDGTWDVAQYWIRGGNTLAAETILGGTSGAFGVDFRTNNLTAVKILSSPASATNYLTIQSSTTANPAILSVDGSTNVGLIIQSKGAESIYLKNTSGANTLKLKWFDSAGGVYRDVISEVGASTSVGIATGFTTVNTASNFNLGNNAVFRAANNVLKIVGSSSTTSSVGVVFGTNSANFGAFAPTTGTHYLINMWSEANNSFSPTSGNANMRMIDLSAFTINQTGTATGNVSLININPTVTSVTGSLYSIKSSLVSGTNIYNLYIDGTAVNYLNGNTSIKTTTATAFLTLGGSTTSNSSLRILSGTAPTSPNDGDIWYDGTNIFIRVGGTTKTFTIV